VGTQTETAASISYRDDGFPLKIQSSPKMAYESDPRVIMETHPEVIPVR
jgi:hypothetical protein